MPLQASDTDDSLCFMSFRRVAACVDDWYAAIPIMERPASKRDMAFFPVVSVSNQLGMAACGPLESSVDVYNEVSNDQGLSSVTLDNTRS